MPQTEGLLDRLNAAAQPGETWPVFVLAALEGKSAGGPAQLPVDVLGIYVYLPMGN